MIDTSDFDQFTKEKSAIDTSAFDTFHAIKNGAPVPTGDTWKDASTLGKIGQVIKGLPQAAYETLYGGAVRAAASTGAALVDIPRQLMGKAPVDVKMKFPGLPEFKTFQAGAQDTFDKFVQDVKDGKDPSALMATASAVGPAVMGAMDIAGVEGLLTGTAKLASKAVPAIKQATENAASSVASSLSKKLDYDLVQTNVKAIDPVLGKVKTTKELIDRTADLKAPDTIFGEVKIDPKLSTVQIASRLSNPVIFKNESIEPLGRILLDNKNPAKNLTVLEKAIGDTDRKLIDVIVDSGDELAYTADKQGIFEKFNIAKQNIPRGFKPNESQFNDVFDYASELIQKAPDNELGMLEVKREFMKNAAREYKNVVKDGFIDDSTPAGSAIKKAYGIMMNHLYSLSPKGSDMARLILREADLMRAKEFIAPKVQPWVNAGFGERLSLQYPKATAVAKIAGPGLVGGATFGAGYQLMK